MGLDITAYQQIELIPCIQNENNEYVNQLTGLVEQNIIKIHQDSEFTTQLNPLQNYSTYKYKYEHHYYSVSYHGYSLWRNKLAEIAGYKSKATKDEYSHAIAAWHSTEGKFHELINFTDCYGAIGHKTIQKLLIDFEKQVLDNDLEHYFVNTYHQIWNAFIFAKDEGLVLFH